MAPTSKASGRTASPAPKASQSPKAKSKAGETSPRKDVKEAEKKESFFNNFTPLKTIDKIAVVVGVAILIGLVLAVGPQRKAAMGLIAKIIAAWNTVSNPVEKFIQKNAELLVWLCVMTSFAPLILIAVFTLFRAVADLANFPPWQLGALVALVASAAAAAVMTPGPARDFTLSTTAHAKATWNVTRLPLETFLVENVDYIVAGSAIVGGLGLLGVIVLALGMKLLWGCRVELATPEEPVAAPASGRSPRSPARG